MLLQGFEEQVLGATLPGLFLALLNTENSPSSRYTHMFFLHARSFCSPEHLLGTFEADYLSNERDEEREHLVKILCVWIQDYWDPARDASVLDHLATLVQTTFSQHACKSSIVTWRIRSRDLHVSDTPLDIMEFSLRIQRQGVPQLPVVSRSLMSSIQSASTVWDVDVLSFDPVELARQITLYENALFCQINALELIYPADSGSDRDSDQSTRITARLSYVRAMTHMSTQLTNWISQCILREPAVKQRTQLLRFFILLGYASYEMQNYNLLMAVLGAIGSGNILRLKQTWTGLHARKIARFHHLSSVMEPTRNFFIYRTYLRQAQGPTLPFLGLILTDITFCKDGNPIRRAFPGRSTSMINLVRLHKLSKIMDNVRSFQKPFAITPVPEIQLFLQWIRDDGQSHSHSDYMAMSEEMYQRSLELEPRLTPKSAPTQARSPSSGRNLRSWLTLKSPYDVISSNTNGRDN